MALDPITAVADTISTIVDKIWPDANEVEKAKFAQLTQEVQNAFSLQYAQIQVDQEEAKSPHWFVAAARPAAMWLGVIGLLYNGVLLSMGNWLALCFHLPPIPPIDSSTMTDLLYALLGLGAARSYDKMQGTDTKRVGR